MQGAGQRQPLWHLELALDRRGRLQLVLDAVQAGRQAGGNGQVRVGISPGKRFSTRRATGELAGIRSPADRLSWDQQALFGEANGWHKR